MSKSVGENSVPVQWTNQQIKAIRHDGSSVLVSAAAGAGKTEVLAQHCAYLLAGSKPPCGINELLVVTFTDAAAAQMRNRISRIVRELSEQEPRNNHLAQQAARVSTAAISTIHAFCQTVLRQNFARAKLDPQFKITDPDEALLLKRAALDEVFEELYLDKGPAGRTFTDLVDVYGCGDDTRLGKLVMRLHEFLGSLVAPDRWSQEALQWLEPVGDKPSREMLEAYGQLLMEHFQHRISLCRSNSEKIRSLLKSPELKSLEPEEYAKLVRFAEVLEEELVNKWLVLIGQAQDGQFDRLAASLEELIVKHPSSPRTRDQAVKTAIDQIKKLFRDATPTRSNERLFDLVGISLAEQSQALKASLPYAQLLVELPRRLEQKYQRAKQAENLLDFTDLERRCLDLLNDGTGGELVPSTVARELQERFRYVLVDEYQDINPLQNAILQLVSRELPRKQGNLFAVGDLKQSIYRFRLAEPAVFQDRLERLSSGKLGRVIDLQSNFRSRAGIIRGVNLLFERLMKAEPADVVYDEHARLKPGQVSYEQVSHAETVSFAGPAIEVHLLSQRSKRKSTTDEETTGQDEEGIETDESTANLDQIQQEAVLVGERIRALMGLEESTKRMQVMDKDPDSGRALLRPIAYRDIAILLRVTTRQAETFAGALRHMDIPVYAEAETGYFAATEIQDMLALLEILDNPLQDIPLAAVLRSPLAGFEANDLARIRLSNKDIPFHRAVFELAEADRKSNRNGLAERPQNFCRRLQDWRKLVRDVPLAEAIWEIYQQTHYLHYVAGLPGGQGRQANLLKLHERARQFSSFTRTSLGRFLQFMRDLQERDADLKLAPGISEAEDVVRIMSVHKSKGLEFPVVILPRLSHQFNFTDAQANIIIDRQRYLGLHYVDRRQQSSYPTLGHMLAEQNIKRHVRAEEMRLFYVALTRAKEHLILVGSGQAGKLAPFGPQANHEELTGQEPPETFELAEGRSWLDWLIPVLASLGPNDLQFVGPEEHPQITQGPATFVVSAYEPDAFDEDIFADDSGKHRRRGGLTLEQIASLEPPAESVEPDEELAQSLTLIDQPYAYEELSRMPAVVPVTERKRLFEAAADELLEAPGPAYGRAETLSGLPDPLSAKSGQLSPTQIGSLNHLFLQKVDIARPCDLKDLQQQSHNMSQMGLFDEDSLAVLDFEGAADFFASEIGKAMLAKPPTVYREIPFVLAIEPGELTEGVEAQGPADKPLVRGIIDVLIVEDSQATIVDFKTDRVSGDELSRRAKAYRWQMQMYGRAVQDILGWTVSRKVLYFLSPPELVSID